MKKEFLQNYGQQNDSQQPDSRMMYGRIIGAERSSQSI